MKWLKRIRIVVAVLFISAISLIYFDIGKILPLWLQTSLVSVQVVPSLMHTLALFTSASIGLFVVLLLTFLFGRIYCSTICPLGILQDFINRAAKRINRRRRFRYKKPKYILHYSIFFITTILAVFGSVVLLNIFEPFSNYGRIISNIVKPVFVVLNNAFADIIPNAGSVIISQIPLLNISLVSVIASILFLGLIVYLSFKHGRLFCNLLCPAGALLGLISRLSIYKIVIDQNNCKECGLCERVCKADCIESSSKKIDFAACIGCFNCIDGCPTGGMKYEGRRQKKRI